MSSDDRWLEFGPEAMTTGLRIFSNIADRWELTPEQRTRLLGLTNLTELERLISDPAPRPERARLERMSHVFAVWRALHTLFSDPARANTWLARPNAHRVFGSKPAIELMASGRLEDLVLVRQYLDAQTA